MALKRYNKSNKTFCVTKFQQDFLSGYGLKNSIVLDNAVNMSNFEPIDETYLKELKIKYNINNDDFILTSVCRLVSTKNLVLSIYSFNELHKQYKNTKFLIVGDGSQNKQLQKLIKILSLEDCCFLVGAVRDKPKLGSVYTLANAICFLSIGDSCGLIQYEGAYFKKPTIAIKNTAIANSLTDLYNGIVLDTNSSSLLITKKIDNVTVDSFVNKVGKLVENPLLCKELGENAFRTVFRTYDDNYAKKLLNLYKNVIKEYKN